MTRPHSDQTNPAPDASPEVQRRAQGNILVVDDNLSNLQVLSTTLTNHGYDVRMATDGPTALMLARAEPPDLFLLDIRMPGMDGYKVCQQLKSEAQTHNIPIIFVSALDELIDKVKGFELGGVDYITKPFQAEEVLARVKTHLTLHALQEELERRNEALQHEIAERIQAQEATSYERDLMQALLDNTTDYIYFKDRDRRFVRASNAFCNLFKCDLEEIIGKRDEELFPPEVAAETVNDDRHVIETGTPLINKEEGGDSIGGEAHWVLTTKLPWYDKDGNIAGLFGISKEITERKQAEQALQASQQFIQSTLNALASTIAIIDEKGTILAVNDAWRRFADQNGLEWQDYGLGQNYLAIAEAASGESADGVLEAAAGIREVIAGKRPEFIQEYPCHSPEEERWFVMRVTPFESSQGVRAVLSHDDITWRKEVEEAQRKRVVELSTLHSIAQTMAAVTDLPESLEAVAETMTYLFDAEVTLITVPAAEETELRILAAFRRNATAPLITTLPVFPLNEMPVTRQVLAQGQSLVLPDVQALSPAAPVRTYVEELDLHAFMLVPLQVRGDVIGVLVVGAQQTDRTFTTGEVVLAETIASDIAAVVKNAQLSEQARLAAVDAERQRLARELHDSVTQSLYSLTLLANGWRTMAAQGRLDQRQVVDSFQQLGEVGQQALKEMRLLIHQLRPPILEEVGLVGALQQRLDAVEQRVNVETHLYTRGPVDELPVAMAEQLFHITLEALNNTLRHARATVVTVNIQVENDRLRLSIQDNGVGFDPAADSMGLGLTTMQERAKAIGGEMSITSTPQQGTTVEITVALQPDERV